MSTDLLLPFPAPEPIAVNKYITTTTSWNKPAGARFVIVQMQGGGGGGGISPAGAVDTNSFIGGGGGAGTYAEALIPGDLITGPVTVGAVTSVGAGAAGLTSYFGTFLTCPGGSPGAAISAGGYRYPACNGGLGGGAATVSGGAILLFEKLGEAGGSSYTLEENIYTVRRILAVTGKGGAPYVGDGGQGKVLRQDGSAQISWFGSSPPSLGGGGSGSINMNPGTTTPTGSVQNGGGGSGGYIRVLSFK